MPTYSVVVTTAGQALLAAAQASGEPVVLTHMAVGDGGGAAVVPDAAMTALVNEVHRSALVGKEVDPSDTSKVAFKGVVPVDAGGFTVREVGIIADDGTLFAVANFPDTVKPLLPSGSGRELGIRLWTVLSDASAVTVEIDPSAIFATIEYVDNSIAAEHRRMREYVFFMGQN